MTETAAAPAPPPAAHAPALIVERALPRYDASLAVHRIVPGSPEAVYAAARRADFLEAWRSSPAVRLMFAVRGLGERAAALVRRRTPVTPPVPDRLRLADLGDHGDWVLLGEDPPHEIAFGVIGRFWAGETVWEQIDAADFVAFDAPDRAKIAASISLRPYGADHTLVTYECRTQGTDPRAAAGFLRYWRLLSPFIGVVLRSHLRVVEAEAARRLTAAAGAPPRG